MNLLREKLRARGHHRACGGDSDASQTDATQDRKVSGRDGAQVSGDGNTVYQVSTDHGAVLAGVEAARDSSRTGAALALATITAGKGIFDSALANTRDVFTAGLSSVDKAYETARAGDQREVSMVALAVVGIVGAVTLFGKR